MSKENMIKRLQAKTPEQKMLQILEHDFRCAPRVAEAILLEAQSCLLGSPVQCGPGQVPVFGLKEYFPAIHPAVVDVIVVVLDEFYLTHVCSLETKFLNAFINYNKQKRSFLEKLRFYWMVSWS